MFATLLTSLLEAFMTPVPTSPPAAAARAIAILIFVAPDTAVPQAILQVIVDLHPAKEPNLLSQTRSRRLYEPCSTSRRPLEEVCP
ncbi:hypothetical protein EV122DRAFT_284038 [Schizophyllum commune]